MNQVLFAGVTEPAIIGIFFSVSSRATRRFSPILTGQIRLVFFTTPGMITVPR